MSSNDAERYVRQEWVCESGRRPTGAASREQNSGIWGWDRKGWLRPHSPDHKLGMKHVKSLPHCHVTMSRSLPAPRGNELLKGQ